MSFRLLSILLLLLLAASCAAPSGHRDGLPLDYEDEVNDLYRLAVRFAPRLYFQEQEPFEIKTLISVFHPSQPVIAYHIFFEDDAVYSSRGKSMDHELVWIQYDPVTLKVMDVFTFWHRTVLRTDDCVMEAKRNGQRPRIDVQWGQHGMLPGGWNNLQTVRPRLELVLHYSLVAAMKYVSAKESGDILFGGSYEAYVSFTKYVDTTPYISEDNIIVMEHPADEIGLRIEGSYAEKKEWPHW
jgi:hypothetical protein